MIETVVQPSLTRGVLYQRLGKLAGEMLRAGDKGNAKKITQLQEKLQRNEVTIAFCGHFSAGKSSMINALMGSEVLPSSPIPTSANVVKIKTGEKGARIYFKEGEPLDFIGEYDLNELKKYAVNGNEVETIELYHPSNLLNVPVSIMDTPGIDSTDDAHKVATESSMHLADAVFYLMDYNHVQSEVNFQFTKELKDKGKRVFLVVNMIDKHVEFELPFSEYRQSVIDAFHHWHIEPDGLFFTSLKSLNHKENQWPLLLEKMGQIFKDNDGIIESVQQSAGYVIEDHLKYLQSLHSEQRSACEQILGDLSPEEALQQYREYEHQLQSLTAPFEMLENEGKKGLQSLLDNAPLTPATTRENARLFLESQQDGFKVGLFFSSNKTKEEQNRRLNQFYEDISEKASVHLEWHVKELLRKIGEKFDIKDPVYQEKTVSFAVPFSKDLLMECVKPGARVNGDYILNYTKEVSEKIKLLYRRQVLALFDETLQRMKNQLAQPIAEATEKVQEAGKLKKAVEELQSLAAREEKAVQTLKDILQNGTADEDPTFVLDQEEKKVITFVNSEEVLTPMALKEKKAPLALHHVVEKGGVKSSEKAIKKDYKGELLHTAEKLRKGAQIVKDLPGLKGSAQIMEQRAERLEQNRFTVALFGAFSAGKSSFANALMGDLILPVSPNPTTAAINKILPPDDVNPHGSVRVRLKSLQDVENDLSHSLKVFNLEAGNIEEGIKRIETIDRAEIQPAAKPHYSFLRAVSKGYKDVENRLGTDLIIGIEEFQQFVAKEEKACFVEWIELYYDCPLTRQGIVLVDTPGADSINARHTGVAFEYIKNSDAVIFVTYYNHAFSHADREFLIQLGRVKSAFELDKMFFVVNAADLAHSQEELDGVVTHVKENLESCGIVKPRIYPVSSQTALLARMAENGPLPESAEMTLRNRLHLKEDQPFPETEEILQIAGLKHFEDEFISFTLDELTHISINSALEEIKRTTGLLHELILKARQDVQQREEQAQKAREEKVKSLEMVRLLDSSIESRTLQKEINELCYYVKQRVMLRFREAFRYAFNPGTIKNDGRSMQKILQGCLDELVHFIAFDLSQEMRATALRVEKYMEKSGAQLLEKLERHINRDDFHVHPWESKTFATPEFESSLPEEMIVPLKGTLSMFKSTKQFFEQGGQEKMRQKLEEQFQAPVQYYVDQGEQILLSYYVKEYIEQIEKAKERTAMDLTDHFTALIAALTMDLDPAVLEETHAQLEELIH